MNDAACPAPAPRRRSTALQVLELFRALDPGARLPMAVAFLYICENEGLCVSELAQVSQFNMAMASRAARSLAERGDPGALEPALGLVRLEPHGRIRALYLTVRGSALKDRLDRAIQEAVMIAGT